MKKNVISAILLSAILMFCAVVPTVNAQNTQKEIKGLYKKTVSRLNSEKTDEVQLVQLAMNDTVLGIADVKIKFGEVYTTCSHPECHEPRITITVRDSKTGVLTDIFVMKDGFVFSEKNSPGQSEVSIIKIDPESELIRDAYFRKVAGKVLSDFCN